MKLDIAQALMMTMVAVIVAIFVGFILGYMFGRDDGRFTEHCRNLGGRVLNDGTCGNETVTHIDAGTR